MIKKILVFLLAALIIIQFFHPERNKATGEHSNYIGVVYPVPFDVKSILAKACDDCHSNNTRYPWYCNFQPVDWWIGNHINNGKKQLNMDEFTNRSLRYQYHKLEEITDQLKKGEMPLNSYTWIHKDARLTPDEKAKLTGWVNAIRDSMKAKYPADSLLRRK